MNRDILLFVKRMIVNASEYCLICYLGNAIIKMLDLSSYAKWIIGALIVAVIATAIVSLFTFLFYKDDFVPVFKRIIRKSKKERINE